MHRLLLVFLLLLPACATTPRVAAVKVTEKPWSYDRTPGRVLETPHFMIYTTISGEEQLDRFPRLMEHAYSQYVTVAPVVDPRPRPLDMFVFGDRKQWVRFTRERTGAEAVTYLRITRGGYALGDWSASFYVGSSTTLSVIVHEGFHQYVARHFAIRPPPAMEEGLSTMFEHIRWKGDQPVIDPAVNPMRQRQLRVSIDDHETWTLREFVTLHAGEIVHLPYKRVDAWYSQNWAFARFLISGPVPQYTAGYQRMLADCASGQIRTEIGMRYTRGWQKDEIIRALEHYLGDDMSTIESRFDQYMTDLSRNLRGYDTRL